MLPGLGDEDREPVRAIPLKMLLGGITAVMLAAFSVALLWDLASGPSRADSLLFVLVLVLAGSAVAVFLQDDPSVRRLRVIERIVFASVTLYLGIVAYASLTAASQSGVPEQVLTVWHTNLVQFILLVVAYGTAIPNTWQRAARASAAMALVPVGIVVGSLWKQGSGGALHAVASPSRIVQSGLALTTAVGLATIAAYVISEYLELAGKTRVSIRYVLKKRIGAGGMGEVWLGEHNLLARPAAIKLIHGDALDRSDDSAKLLLRRFEREAQATARLRSPHTVEIYDFGVASEGIFYYAMEYLDGLDLRTLVQRHGPLPPERVVHLLAQVCESLAEAHDQGLLHRDIKPANIFVCRLGRACDAVKVLDFGLVKGDPLTSPDGTGTTELTLEGEIAGTPGYMAPESILAGGSEPDARADLYAVGCVGYYLLTGTPVFEGPKLAVLVEHARSEPAPPSSRVETPIPDALERVILKCLAKNPSDRFETATDLADALREAVTEPPWQGKRAAEWWRLHGPQTETLQHEAT